MMASLIAILPKSYYNRIIWVDVQYTALLMDHFV